MVALQDLSDVLTGGGGRRSHRPRDLWSCKFLSIINYSDLFRTMRPTVRPAMTTGSSSDVEFSYFSRLDGFLR